MHDASHSANDAAPAAGVRATDARVQSHPTAMRHAGWRKGALPLSILMAGVALSLVFAYLAHREAERNAQQRFDRSLTAAANRVEGEFAAYADVLTGLGALFHAHEGLTRDQFHRYVAGLQLGVGSPDFDVLNFAPHVRGDQREAFEDSVRRDTTLSSSGYPDFAITPPGVRPDYYPLTYLEPMTGNAWAFGRDMGAIPAARAALHAARDTGQLTSSGRLIQIRGDSREIGLAMRVPVYRAGMPLDTVEQRREAYIGSVGSGFRVTSLMRSVLDGAELPLRLRLFDGGQSGGPDAAGANVTGDDHLLYDTAVSNPAEAAQVAAVAPAFDATVQGARSFERGGRQWIVQASADASLLNSALDRALPWLVLLAGLAISSLMAGIIHALSTSRAQAISLARSMTRDLRAGERRLGEAQQLAQVGSWILDSDSGILQCSSEARRILAFDDTALPTLGDLLLRIPADQRTMVERGIAAAARSAERGEFEHRLMLPDGGERWVHLIVQQALEGGRMALRGTIRDDTTRKRATLRLQLEHVVASLLAGDDDTHVAIGGVIEAICRQLDWEGGVWWQATSDGLQRCSVARQIAGDEALAAFFNGCAARTRRPRAVAAWTDAMARRPCWMEVDAQADGLVADARAIGIRFAAGVIVPVAGGEHAASLELFSRTPGVRDAETLDSLQGVAMQVHQFLQRKRAEQALRYVASHDALTGLSNRAQLDRQLGQAIKRCDRHRKRLALMFLDVDRFKHVNDTLGHGVGDAMIRACADRLRGVVREGDLVARFGGDEFVLVLEDLSEAHDAITIAEKVLAACGEPFVIDGHDLRVTASVGISIYPDDGADGETLLKNADVAMYRAKERGGHVFQFYAAQMNAQGSERLMLESGLRTAMQRGELSLHYQPKMDLRTRAITGVEALMRWTHPVLGNVSPARFIPIAEETGLIVAMGRWALETACRDGCEWQALGLPPVQMSVNLSTRQLDSPTLIDDIAAVLRDTGFDPGLLELEITESAMMHNPQLAVGVLQRVRDMGVYLAIDDFGTGYSSLSYLQRFPLSTVKLDGSFVRDLSRDAATSALTRGVIALAHGLNMKVVAEGVETHEQFASLRSLRCDQIQGYLLCRPIPSQEIFAFMQQHQRTLFAPAVA